MDGVDDLYCKYSFNYGLDWSTSHGLEHGISQIAQKGTGDQNDVFVWNYPIEATFRSTNVHGWPQIVLSVYGINAIGKDVIRGYGCVHMPISPGRHVRYVRLYTPMSSSKCQQLQAWLTANPPEFFDAKFTAQTRGREVTRVNSKGMAKLVVNVSTRNLEKWGYSTGVESALKFDAPEMETVDESMKTFSDKGELRKRKGSADSTEGAKPRGRGRGRDKDADKSRSRSRSGSESRKNRGFSRKGSKVA